MKSYLVTVLTTIALLSPSSPSRLPDNVGTQAAVPNLAYQANLYGNSAPETIEYLADLNYYSWGGFGTNAHVFRSRLQSSGEEIAYAVSTDLPNAFAIDVLSPAGEQVRLSVASAAYSNGTVEAVSSTEIHYVWDISQYGLRVKLHRYARLIRDERVTTKYVVQERFAVENLGPTITLIAFSEYLHMDDRARVRDYDNDGRDETLLAINAYTTNGYPVFGKVYLNRAQIVADLVSDGVFATVTQNLFVQNVGVGTWVDIDTAAYVSSVTQDDVNAELEVAKDAAVLLGLSTTPDQWLVRTYNTDDAGAMFINGLMVAGSMYGSYPDSYWASVNKYWRQGEDNYVSLASYDAGGCCSSTWGFSLRRNGSTLWDQKQSGGAGAQGVAYQHTLRVSPAGPVVDYSPPLPSPSINGSWSVQVRANGGMAFALVDNQPVAGSTYNQAQWVEITSRLGQYDNHVTFNAWDNGGSTFAYYLAIKSGDQVVWESQQQVTGGSRGRAYHQQLVIDANGAVYPQLDYPVDYKQRSRGSVNLFNTVFSRWTTSLFDHEYPDYENDGFIEPYTGDRLRDPGSGFWGPEDDKCLYDADPLNCYDGHSGYDVKDICPDPTLCSNPRFVYPAADGVIVQSETGWLPNLQYGNALGCEITIDHGGQWKTVYAHLFDPEKDRNCERILRRSGTVTRFDRIGIIGCSGTGCLGNSDHLHFEVRHNDRAVDPSGWDPPNIPDPWAARADGATSFPQWLYRQRVVQAVSNVTGGQINTLENIIQVGVPAGYYGSQLTFSLSSVPAADPADQLVNSGVSFSLRAADNTGTSVSQLNGNLELRVNFTSDNTTGVRPNTLSMYTWDTTTAKWLPIPTTLDMAHGIATAYVNHLSIYALMGARAGTSYLPLVRR